MTFRKWLHVNVTENLFSLIILVFASTFIIFILVVSSIIVFSSFYYSSNQILCVIIEIYDFFYTRQLDYHVFISFMGIFVNFGLNFFFMFYVIKLFSTIFAIIKDPSYFMNIWKHFKNSLYEESNEITWGMTIAWFVIMVIGAFIYYIIVLVLFYWLPSISILIFVAISLFGHVKLLIAPYYHFFSYFEMADPSDASITSLRSSSALQEFAAINPYTSKLSQRATFVLLFIYITSNYVYSPENIFSVPFLFFPIFYGFITRLNFSVLFRRIPKKAKAIDSKEYTMYCICVNGFRLFYSLVVIFFVFLSFYLGKDNHWKSPVKVYNEQYINYTATNFTYDFASNNSEICEVKYDSLDLMQISAIPILSYMVPREFQHLDNLSVFQEYNFNNVFNMIFGENRYNYTLANKTRSSFVLHVSDNETEKYKILVLGGFRSPLDWLLFLEVYVTHMIKEVIKGVIPFYYIISSFFASFISSLEYIIYPLFNLRPSILRFNDRIMEYLPSDIDFVVGQGIGGVFAKLSSEDKPVYSFDSLPLVGLYSENTKRPKIYNFFSNSIYSSSDSKLSINVFRDSEYQVFPEVNAFYSFCYTVAMCEKTPKYHDFCMSTLPNKYISLLKKYDRINVTTSLNITKTEL